MQKLGTDVIIIGGGVIGLTSALVLADAGREVVLIESGRLGQEASWAGGGIMSPLYAWRYPRSLDTLLRQSLAVMPALVARIQSETGIDPEFYETGLWVLSLPPQERREAITWACSQGWPVSAKAFDLFHFAARSQPEMGLWFPKVSNIRNPRLIQGLAQLVRQNKKISIYENAPAKKVFHQLNHVKALWSVETPDQRIQAPDVVCAAGAWSSTLLEAARLNCPKLIPAQGQMLLLKPSVLSTLQAKGIWASGQPCPMVLSEGKYIVPRCDGHILVGSTVEYVGYRKCLAAEAQAELSAFAGELFGFELGDEHIEAHWAGLRPDPGQAVPIIGPHPDYPGLWLNTGHFRNGLVLAMGSAELLCTQMMTKPGATDVLSTGGFGNAGAAAFAPRLAPLEQA
jgi:glycine oxidase